MKKLLILMQLEHTQQRLAQQSGKYNKHRIKLFIWFVTRLKMSHVNPSKNSKLICHIGYGDFTGVILQMT